MALDLSGLSKEQQIAKAAQYAGVPASVLDGMWATESSRGVHQDSPAGAQGDFGIMPTTREAWEQRIGRKLDPYNFTDSLTVAANQLKENLGATGGNIVDALKMYNAGTDRARWDNPETEAYPGKVLGNDFDVSTAGTGVGFPRPDVDEAWRTSAFDIQRLAQQKESGNVNKQYLSKVEQGTLNETSAQAAVAKVLSGDDQDAATQAAMEARSIVTDSPAAVTSQALTSLNNIPSGNKPDEEGWNLALTGEQQARTEATKEQAVTVADKVKAAFDSNTLTAQILRAHADNMVHPDDVPDPTFPDYYWQNRKTIEEGRSDDEVDALREAQNKDQLVRIQTEQDQARQDAWTIAANSSKAGVIGYSLLGGTMDPAGWIAGLGVGKVAQVLGVGARAAFEAGQIGRGIAYSAGEGAAGNVLLTAGLDAAGKHESTADYAHAAGMGLAFGAAFAGPAARRVWSENQLEDFNRAAEAVQKSAPEYNAELYTKAQAQAGSDASPEDIAAAADDIESKESQDFLHAITEPPAPEQQLNVGPTAEAVEAADKQAASEPVVASVPFMITNKMRKALGEQGFSPEEIGQMTPEDAHAALSAGKTYKLPDDLGGAKPRYSLGQKKYQLSFANDVDKAAYIAAQKTPSKRDQDYVDFVKWATGIKTDEEVRAYGGSVRAAIKALAAEQDGGTINVASMFNPKVAKRPINAAVESPSVSEALPKRTVYARQEGPKSASVSEEVGELGGEDEIASQSDTDAPTGRQEVQPETFQQRAMLGSTTDQERLFPRPDINTPAEGDEAAGEVLGPDSVFKTPEALYRTVKANGLDVKISNEAERNMVAEVIARSERRMENTPINTAALKPLIGKLGWEAPSTRLLASDSKPLQAFAVTALENPEGAAGRVPTASIAMATREKLYLGDVEHQYDSFYNQWITRKGISRLKNFVDQKARQEFDNLVYAERDRRNMRAFGTKQDPEVDLAASLLDKPYNAARRDQKFVGTIGSVRLPNEDVAGYQPRLMAPGVIGALSDGKLRAYQRAFSSELVKNEGWDKEFADQFAVKYMERARTVAKGGFDVPANLHSSEAADIMEDALRAMRLPEDDIARVMARFARGAQNYTKARLKMSLTTPYPDGEGGYLKIMDLMKKDNISLLKGYVQKAAGEVALAQYGIMGKTGLKLIRKAAEVTGASNRELESFDQVASEFTGGRPFNSHKSVFARRMMTLTSAMKLGGMGMAQSIEYTNALASIGISHAMESVAELPRIIGEVHNLVKGKDVHNPLLSSIEPFVGQIGVEGYKMGGLYDINLGHEVYGQESLGLVDRMLHAAGHFNRVASGQRIMQAAQTRGISEHIILKALRRIKDGGEDAALDDMGITADIRDALRPQLSRIATFEGGHAKSFDAAAIDNPRVANAFVTSVVRGASQIIQETFIGETGKWVHDDWLRLLTQFRHFGLVATQKQWGRNRMTYGSAKALAYLLAAMSIGIPVQAARVYITALGMEQQKQQQYIENNMSPLALARSTMNYISAAGNLSDVLDIGASAFGYNAAGGRFNNQSEILGGQLVPAVGTINNAWEVLQSALNPTKKVEAKQVLHLLPASNLPYLQAAINFTDHNRK